MEHRDIDFDNDVIEQEYWRCMDKIGDEDPYDTDETVGIFDVLRAHFLIADYFYSKDSGLGGVGPKSHDLLHSAVYRQFVSMGGIDKWKTPFEKAATLLYGIISDHPFYDANKRTGLLVMLLFFKKMNRTPKIDQKSLEDFAVDISDHNLKKYSRHKKLEKKYDDADVLFIADYLKRNTRKLDTRTYTITFRELDKKLRSFGYEMKNASGNYIDIVRVEERRRLFGFGKKENVDVRVAQVGFPGWKSQVRQSAISTIRKATKLTPEYGFDSQSFFNGVDPVNSLIDEYASPLERLAYR